MPRIALILLLTLLASPAFCGEAPAADEPAVTIPNTTEFTLHSKATGRDYLIQIAYPTQPAPDGGYPVLYVLDGNAYWPLMRLVDQLFTRHGPRASPTPMLIVGIGYPDVARFDYAARADDYTPTGRSLPLPHQKREHGGADAFLRFINHTLKPAIQQRFPVDQTKDALFGHSYGGLFVVYTLLHQPLSFSRYLAIAPSLWWDPQYVTHYTTTASRKADMQHRCAFIGVGALSHPREPAGHDIYPAGTTLADLARQLHATLSRTYPHMTTQLQVFAGERHGTVIWPAARQAMQFLKTCH